MTLRITLTGLAVLFALTAAARGAAEDTDTLLNSLIGQDEATIRQRFGLPDHTERNGVQTFFTYNNFDAWRTGIGPEPFGYSQGYAGPLGLRGRAAFECTTVLVFRGGILRAYSRQGSGCRH